MTAGRVVVVATSLVLAGLSGWFALAWEQADRAAAAVAAVAGVAGVGVAVWSVLVGGGSSTSVRVSGTGKARAGMGGRANTGVRGEVRSSVRVKDTGDADASGDGEANTGVRGD